MLAASPARADSLWRLRGSLGSPRRAALIALAAAIVLAGVLIAVFTAGGGHPRHVHAARPKRPAARISPPALAIGTGRLALAARYLGLAPTRLRAALHGGRSLAEIARSERGHSVKGLLEALVGARVARIEAREKRGTLTKARAKTRIAHLRARTLQAIERTSGGSSR